MTHELKIYRKFADAVVSGKKTWEIRFNDRGYKAGDLVHFRLFNPETKKHEEHPIERDLYEITHILDDSGLCSRRRMKPGRGTDAGSVTIKE